MAILLHDLRRSPRFPAHLEAHLFFKLVLVDLSSADAARSMLFLTGHTRDISEQGLSLVLPVAHIEERFLSATESLLRITLQLPDGPVGIEAAPVHHRPLEEAVENQVLKTGYLIGAEIKRMTNSARFNRLIEELRSRTED